MSPSKNQVATTGGRLQHVIQWNISVVQMFAIVGTIGGAAISLYIKGNDVANKVGSLEATVTELRQDVKNMSVQASLADKAQTLLKYRIDALETDVKTLKEKR